MKYQVYLASMKRRLLFATMLISPYLLIAQVSMNVDLLFNWNDTALVDNGFGSTYNETWGFVQDGVEYGVIGSTFGTHIFRLTEQNELMEVDRVPGRFQGSVVHRDFHDHNGYLYAICQQGASSLQIMDLQWLPDSVQVVYDSDSLFAIAHNVFIDTATSKLYVDGPPGHAMSVYDITDPVDPVFLSHFDGIEYVHDCFVRNDSAYLNGATEGLFVYDFTNPSNPTILGSLTTYQDQGFNHSGWLSADGDTYVFADENRGLRMKLVDVSDLTDITTRALFNSEVSPNTIPHNLMLKNDIVYVSHYNDGLRIFDVTDQNNPVQVGYYDTDLEPDTAGNFVGAWGVYSFLPSGRILISDLREGLFLFKFDTPTSVPEEAISQGFQVYPNPSNGAFQIQIAPSLQGFPLQVYDIQGQLLLSFDKWKAGEHSINLLGLGAGMYILRLGTADQRIMIR